MSVQREKEGNIVSQKLLKPLDSASMNNSDHGDNHKHVPTHDPVAYQKDHNEHGEQNVQGKIENNTQNRKGQISNTRNNLIMNRKVKVVSSSNQGDETASKGHTQESDTTAHIKQNTSQKNHNDNDQSSIVVDKTQLIQMQELLKRLQQNNTVTVTGKNAGTTRRSNRAKKETGTDNSHNNQIEALSNLITTIIDSTKTSQDISGIDAMLTEHFAKTPSVYAERRRHKHAGFEDTTFSEVYTEIVKNHDTTVKITQTFVRNFLKEIVAEIKEYNNEKLPKSINLDTIVKSIADSLPKNMDTDNFYIYVSEYLVAKSSQHYFYDLLASRIAMKRLHNITSPDFLTTARLLQENLDKNNDRSPILSDETFDVISRHHTRFQEAIKYERDFMFDYFGIKTLERSYLYKLHFSKFKIIERPQHMIMRVAIGIHGEDVDSAIETYDLISQKYFTHATPTLFNSGTKRAQMSSCFLQAIDDSIESIFDAVRDIAFTSKWSGGIGVHLSALRSRGSLIRGTNGLASGIIPLCVLLNKLAKYINQGGKRNGSIACYLEPHHADIFDFCDLRKNTGNDDNRARDLYLALWVSSLFMKRVKEDSVWSLMCPDECPGLNQVHSEEYAKLYEKYESEGRYVRQVKARELWRHILEAQSETGFPYILYKDNANKKSNQKNLGTIRSSNLCAEIIQYSDDKETAVCFTGDTDILTKDGIKKIVECDGAEVLSYFNNDKSLTHDEHYEVAKLIHNGKKQIYELTTQGNKPLRVTKDHPVLVRTKVDYNKHPTYRWKKVSELVQGDMVCTPNINQIPGFDFNIKDNMDTKWLSGGSMLSDEWMSSKGIKKVLGTSKTIPDVVKNGSPVQIANFLSGLFSADGCIVHSKGELSINLPSASKTLLHDVQSLLIPFGIKSQVSFGVVLGRLERSQGTLSIHGELNLSRYMSCIGFKLCQNKEDRYSKLMRLQNTVKKQEHVQDCSKVVSVKKLGVEDVYDLALPESHNFFANGHVVHNCNLASICLPMYIETDEEGKKIFNYERLGRVCRVAVRNLDKIIDRNYYPTEKTKTSNMRHRPMGIGVQGLADVYNIMGHGFSSPEAYDLNNRIFETIYYNCIDESKELAKRFGQYSTFKGSPASQGQLQFHMWGVSEDQLLMGYDWKKLVEDVKRHGLRNSLLTALMPTASTSQIMGNSECIEPYMSNIFKRSTLAGEFIVVNKNLMKDLLDLNLWDDDMRKRLIIENGSVQNIDSVPEHIKKVYETAFETKQMHIVRQSADRGKFVDQSQSLNLFMAEPDFDILTSALFESHDLGNKTGMYYYRSLPAINPINFGIDVEDIKRLTGRDATIDVLTGGYNITKDDGKKIDDTQVKKVVSKRKTKATDSNESTGDAETKPPESGMCKWKPGMKIEDCLSCGS